MPPRANDAEAAQAGAPRLRAVLHSAGWPAAWRFRFALRALALAIIARETGATTPEIEAAARRLIVAWQGVDAAALRRAERALAAALIAHLARIDSFNWMNSPAVRIPGHRDGAA